MLLCSGTCEMSPHIELGRFYLFNGKSATGVFSMYIALNFTREPHQDPELGSRPVSHMEATKN